MANKPTLMNITDKAKQPKMTISLFNGIMKKVLITLCVIVLNTTIRIFCEVRSLFRLKISFV